MLALVYADASSCYYQTFCIGMSEDLLMVLLFLAYCNSSKKLTHGCTAVVTRMDFSKRKGALVFSCNGWVNRRLGKDQNGQPYCIKIEQKHGQLVYVPPGGCTKWQMWLAVWRWLGNYMISSTQLSMQYLVTLLALHMPQCSRLLGMLPGCARGHPLGLWA